MNYVALSNELQFAISGRLTFDNGTFFSSLVTASHHKKNPHLLQARLTRMILLKHASSRLTVDPHPELLGPGLGKGIYVLSGLTEARTPEINIFFITVHEQPTSNSPPEGRFADQSQQHSPLTARLFKGEASIRCWSIHMNVGRKGGSNDRRCRGTDVASSVWLILLSSGNHGMTRKQFEAFSGLQLPMQPG